MTVDYPIHKKQQFLIDLANLPGGGAGFIVAAFNQKTPPGDQEAEELLKKYPEVLFFVGDRLKQKAALWDLAAGVRQAWREPDQRSRDWLLYVLRDKFANYANPKREKFEVPPFSLFEDIMTYFQRHPGEFRFCQNMDCRRPFYVPSTRKPTKFCSFKCGLPAKRESRLKYYRKGGR